MNLYYVQDDDRPMHVVALDFGDAVSRWRRQIGKENEGDEEYTPKGVTLIASGTDADSFPDLLLPEAAPATLPPAPVQAGWTEPAATTRESWSPAWTMQQRGDALMIATVAAKGGPRNANRWDDLCEALSKIAPHFHKVRVRVPSGYLVSSPLAQTHGVALGCAEADRQWIAALRAQGVEIEGEQ